MNRLRNVVFLLCLAAWVLIARTNVATAMHQCNGTGAIVMDNFDAAPYTGWYCSYFQDNSQLQCSTSGQQDLCTEACTACGGSLLSSNPCNYQFSATTTDSTAQYYGCSPSQYAQKYIVSCNCTYPPPTCGSCNDSSYCCSTCFGTWDGYTCDTGSPLIISLRGDDRPQLTSAEDGVWFDLNHTGVPQRVAWTRAGDAVGFLVMDRNHNGIIDDGSELFGTSTSRPAGKPFGNGFDILADLDAASGAPDGRIDQSDAVFADLRVWVDLNHNGYSEPEELLTLQQAGIDALFTAYRESRQHDQFGNQFRYVGTVEFVSRHGRERRERMYDVFLKIAVGATE